MLSDLSAKEVSMTGEKRDSLLPGGKHGVVARWAAGLEDRLRDSVAVSNSVKIMEVENSSNGVATV